MFEGEGGGGGDWSKGWGGQVGDSLVLLADSTPSDKFGDKNGEARPPEITFNNCFGAEAAKVTRERGIMDGVE